MKVFIDLARSASRRFAICAVAAAAALLSVRAAVVELVDGQKVEGRPSFSADGRISVAVSNGEPRQLDWKQVRVAQYKGAETAQQPLPQGWHAEDIGKVNGNSSDANGTYTFKVEDGEVSERKYQPLHFAQRIVRGEPFAVARLMEVTGPAPALGGVMLRDGLDVTSGYALLGITSDKKLRFELRENAWAALTAQDLGPVTPPIWLKVFRAEKDAQVMAYRSSDGVTWQQVAQGKLSAHSEPYPAQSDQWKPRLYAGLALTAPTNGAPASLKGDQASVGATGLLGEYFADKTFTKLDFARLDRQIEFWWGDRSPAPTLEPENFAVRWSGVIEPKFTESYRFYYHSNDSRLWINGELLPPLSWDDRRSNEPVKEVPLVAGKKYDIRFEFRPSLTSKSARLGWSSRSQPRESIPMSSLSYTFGPHSPDEQAVGSNVFHPAGIWLRDGTFLAGEVTSASSSATVLAFGGNKSTKPLTILNGRIARVILRSNRRPLNFELAGNRTGIFLQSGDFLESELDQVNSRQVVTSSLLFGRRTYSRDSSQALAIVFAEVMPVSAPLLVHLTDGSIIRARKLRSTDSTLVADVPAIGDLPIALSSVREVRNSAIPVQSAAR